jgi:Putative beta barrel porin-7 (BBP7)
MRTLFLSAIVGLLVVISPALAQVPTTSSIIVEQDLAPQTGGGASGGRIWATGEYLMWWLRGDRLPPLVTTSPSGTPVSSAGVLGVPVTQILFGDNSVNTGGRSGGRLTAGYWLDCEQTWGIQASYFQLESLTRSFGAQSNGSPILARPFQNTATGMSDSELVAFPGVIDGSVSASVRSSSLLGAEALLRRNLLNCCTSMGTIRLDALAGYRFLYFDESLSLQENLISTSTTNPVPAGTSFVVRDQFCTHNVFNGGELGLAASAIHGRWTLDVVGKVALGGTYQTVDINGSTATAVPGGPATVLPGGLLALSSNSGLHSATTFSWVPELDFNLSYRITKNVRLTVGYSVLCWTQVVRPGDQIDTSVNPNLLPPVVPGGSQHPAFGFNRSTLVGQGVSAGLEFRY